MKYSYSSNFKPFIEGLVQQKNAVGFKYESAEYYLSNFDHFCRDQFPNVCETNFTCTNPLCLFPFSPLH